MTDEQLQELYGAHLRARANAADGATDAPAAAAGCASPEALLALVRREGPEAQRLAVLDHVMGCAHCRAELDLLRAIEAAGAELAQPPTAGVDADVEARGAVDVNPARLRRDRPAWPRWAGAAGLALAASIVLAVGITRQRREPAYERGASADDVMLVAPASDAVVPAGGPVRFVWRTVPGATRYEIEALTPDGAAVLTGTTVDTVFQPADLRGLQPGITHRWWVRAMIDDGGTPRRSAMRELRVK